MLQKALTKLAAVLLFIIIVFTACGNADPETTRNSLPNVGQAVEPENSERITDINVMYLSTGDMSGYGNVEDAVNAITESKINVHVTLEPVLAQNYASQLALKLSGDGKLDVLLTTPEAFVQLKALVSQNQLKPLDELLSTYGQGILEAVPDNYINKAMIDNITYGIPCYSDKVNTCYYFMRKDIVDKYKIDVSDIKSLDDIEAVLKLVKENEPELAPLVPSTGSDVLTGNAMLIYDSFDQAKTYDPLVGNFAVIMLDGDSSKVLNYYETEEFMKTADVMKRWNDAGYIYEDAAENTLAGSDLIREEKGFSFFGSNNGQFSSVNTACGYEMAVVSVKMIPITTSAFTDWTWAIPWCATEEAAAMKFINLMYTSADIVNLLTYGIEGVHYEQKDDGTIGNGSGYYQYADWTFGNEFMSKIWEGNHSNTRQIALEKMAYALWSPAAGFIADTSAVEKEISKLNAIIDEYSNGLCAGVLEPETDLPEFIEKLKDNGMQKVIAEIQGQYDEWRSAQEE